MTERKEGLWEKIYSPVIFSLAIRNLKLNKTRTLLSMVGIIIGVLAICGMGMVGAGFSENINEMISDDANMLMLTSIEEKNIDGRVVHGFNDNDVSDIEAAVQTVTSSYIIIEANAGTKYVTVDRDGTVAMLGGMSEEGLEAVLEKELKEGTLPRSAGGVVVLEDYAEKHNLHVNSRISTTDAYGDKVTLRVTGIMESNPMTENMAAQRDMCFLFGTLELYENLLGTNDDLYTQVAVKVDDALLLNPLEEAVERGMNGKAYKDSDDTVSITNTYDMVDSLNEVLDLTNLFTLIISGISLLVASIAIVNVMMMSVKERTKEIGILRSIGTRRKQILQMFIYEAGVIGLVGAGIGVVLSCAAVPILMIIMMDTAKYMLAPSVLAYIPLGILIGVSVCLAAGLYPAMKAARLNPVEAMAND